MANPKKRSNSNELCSETPERIVATDEQRVHAEKTAEAFQSNLSSEHPTFVISMLKSQVSGGFWLSLPREFCEVHLGLKEKFGVVLESKNGSEHNVTYIGYKPALSGGWKGFCIDHKLHEGDAVLFQLKAEKIFKVYIFRAVGVDIVDVQEMKYTREKKSLKSKKVKRSHGDAETRLDSKNVNKPTDQDTGVQNVVELPKAKERKSINSKKAKMCNKNGNATKKPRKPVKDTDGSASQRVRQARISKKIDKTEDKEICELMDVTENNNGSKIVIDEGSVEAEEVKNAEEVKKADSGSLSTKPQTKEKLFRKRPQLKLFRKRIGYC